MSKETDFSILSTYPECSSGETSAYDFSTNKKSCKLSHSKLLPGNWTNPGKELASLEEVVGMESINNIKVGKNTISLDVCELEDLYLLLRAHFSTRGMEITKVTKGKF